MARRRQTAAEFIDEHDVEMRVILGEMIENAAKANVNWETAVRLVRHRPERAFETLIDAEICLDVPVRIERADALRTLRAAINRLDAELPDDEEDPGDPSLSGDITGH